MSRQNLSVSDQNFYGNVRYARANQNKPGYLVTPPPVLVSFGNVFAAAAAQVSALQTLVGAGNLLINGSKAAAGIATADMPRNVTLASTGDISGVTFTVTGKDLYGATVIENIVGPNNATVSGKKSFKTVSQIAASAAVGTNLSAQFGNAFGLPLRTDANGLIIGKFNNLAGADAGTFVPAVTTVPATALTGDTRGTYTPAGAIDGTKPLSVLIVPAGQQTKAQVYGVDQFGGAP